MNETKDMLYTVISAQSADNVLHICFHISARRSNFLYEADNLQLFI